MANIYVIGECAMDFIKNEGAGDKAYRRVPGGCAVNVAAELGKLIKEQDIKELTPAIIARVGDDSYGRAITESLESAGVNTAFLNTDVSSTSVVYMDIDVYGQRNCAGRCSGADIELNESDVKDIKFTTADALCFTSGGFLSASSMKAHECAVKKAVAAGALICFDINIREGLWKADKAKELLTEYIRLADIIKIKGHELRMLFEKPDINLLLKEAKGKVWVVHTDGFVEKHYKREGAGGEVATDIRLPERFYREVGMGDELFAQIILKGMRTKERN